MPHTNWPLVQAVQELANDNLTQYQVAKKLGITQSNVSIIVKRHKIKWNYKRRDQWGSNNHSYQNGLAPSTIERATRRILQEAGRDLTKCERCGYIDFTKQELPRHHKDRNRSNNALSNLEILCWGCHSQEHMSERTRDKTGRFSNG